MVSMPRSKAIPDKKPPQHGLLGPQGAPRGLLRHYILHRIAEKPAHGYDILREIASKTEGSWRPGAGSVYPILKELLEEKYIKAEPSEKSRTSQRVYRLTHEGEKYLQHHKGIPAKIGR